MVYSLYKKFHTKISFSSLKFSILEGSLLLLVIILISIDIPYKAFIINILFGIQVFIFSFARGIFSHFFKHKLFLLLGTLSYSIYMIHVFIIFSFLWLVVLVEKIWLVELTPMIGDTAYIDFGSSLTNNILILFLLLLIIFIAKYTYRYIEVKGQKWGKRINKSFS